MQKRVNHLVLVVICLATTLGAVGVVAADGSKGERPLADAGLDQTVQQNSTVYLDAGGSVAPDGELVSFDWEITHPDGTTSTPTCPECEETSFQPTETGTYAVTVTVTDDADRSASDTLYVTVHDGDLPELSLVGPETVGVGEEATVEVTATAGEAPLSSITWLVDGTQHNATFLEGEQATDDINPPTAEPGIRTIDAELADVQGRLVTTSHELSVLTDGPHFDITITETSDPVTAGEVLEVTTEIQNTGQETDRQAVVLETSDGHTLAESDPLTLAPETGTTHTIEWETAPGDSAIEQLQTKTANDTDSTDVTINESAGEASFTVESVITPAEATVGEEQSVEAFIRNTGSEPATQYVDLLNFDTETVDTQKLSLAPDEAKMVTLEWVPEPEAVGSGEITVQTQDDSEPTPVTVTSQTSFEVEITDIDFGYIGPDPTTMHVDATINNTGHGGETQTLNLCNSGGNGCPDSTTPAVEWIYDFNQTLGPQEQTDISLTLDNLDDGWYAIGTGADEEAYTLASEDDHDTLDLGDDGGGGGTDIEMDGTPEGFSQEAGTDFVYVGDEFTIQEVYVEDTDGETYSSWSHDEVTFEDGTTVDPFTWSVSSFMINYEKTGGAGTNDGAMFEATNPTTGSASVQGEIDGETSISTQFISFEIRDRDGSR